ncbi:hypothetical protein QAD02_023226 [Eretmocerus hayati]|uniref:Uncharacterized protein n=1 Tax=Eretmocerus hayati TaxID=131215 RepID=A0ACC2PYM4_9HYME|nr:hypothetical protein QAD02_023226 [Eretmocerus hayati]
MSSSVLDCFPKLLKDNTTERVEAGVKLLRHLSHEVKENGENKETNHILRRLIRGLGSSKVSSRKGFYSTLAVYLTLNTDVSAESILGFVETELKATGSSSKSETADVHNGRILACGAVIRSKLLARSSEEEQKKVLEILLHSGKQRSYLSFESMSFLIEYLNQIEETAFQSVWSLIEPEICKQLTEQTLDSFYALLVIQEKFPNVLTAKLIKKKFGHKEIINQDSIADIVKILTNIPRVACYKHPMYKVFCEKLIVTEFVEQFWVGFDEHFKKASKSDEYLGVELFNLMLTSLKDESVIPILLSPNFVRHMLKRLSNNPKNKTDEVANLFKKALTLMVNRLNKDVKTKIKITVLKKLIFSPGDLMIEKLTGIKVLQILINNLNAEGVKKVSNLFKEIAANTKFKEKLNSSIPEPWTNNERTYVTQLLTVKLMSHPELASDHEWRLEQQKFLFKLGLCETDNIGVELSPLFKDSFYRSLDNKLPKLNDLRAGLSALITWIDDSIFQTSEFKLRTALDATSLEAWRKMLKLVKKLEKDSKYEGNIGPVFHTMNLHMGLQLFSDPEMATSAIDELHSCFEHYKSKQSAKNTSSSENGDEPEWIEVVVDLLLSLLSKKSHLLRSLVGCVFPHICAHLTPNAINQILAVLDIKSGKNPLSASGDDEESSSEEEADEEDEEEEEQVDEDESEQGTIEEESDSDVEVSDLDDETMTDRLRLAVRQALGDATVQTDDEDMDVDQINEEDGKRLDESLAAAFRILKENRKTRMKKQERDAQALTHFRIRVIDLLEIYFETSSSMTIALDMLVPLFALLEFSIKDPHQKPLEHRVRSCLKKLSAIRKFKDIEGVDEERLTTVLKALMEKGERSASVCQEMGDKLAECCVFLVRCSQQTSTSPDGISRELGESLTAFFKKRDCILPAILFKSLLQLNWEGNWYLAPLLVDFAFDESIRSYRRGQALELLKIFYNNVRMITLPDCKEKKYKIESKLCELSTSVLSELSQAMNAKNGKLPTQIGIKQKYVCNLLSLLLTVYAHHVPEAWDWKKIGESMATYRSTVTLAKDAKKAYNKLANRIGAPVVTKTEKKSMKPQLSNGNHSSPDSSPRKNKKLKTS